MRVIFWDLKNRVYKLTNGCLEMIISIAVSGWMNVYILCKCSKCTSS